MGRNRSGSPRSGSPRRRKRRVRRRVSRSPGGRSPARGSRSPPPRSRSPPARSQSQGSPRRGGSAGGSASPGKGDGNASRSRSGPRRRKRRRRVQASRSRGRRSRSGPPPLRRSASNPLDRRPRIERDKGGVKLFIGRLPKEVNQRQLKECFEEFGEVQEVFIIASQAASGVGCAFVRMSKIPDAEEAIADLHEQRVLIPEMADLGPMQVAFAKGEAIRLGINEKEEILPSFREARQKVEEHKEKKQFFDTMKKQQEVHEQLMIRQQAVAEQSQMMAQQAPTLATNDLVSLVKDGQRNGGQPFKLKWYAYCDQGWAGTRDYDPGHHPKDALAQFVAMSSMEYGHEPWFRKHFKDLPDLPPMPPMPPGGPPGAPGMPPMPPGGPPMPPGMMPPPGMGPPGMPPMMPPFGMPPGMMPPGMMPGMPPMMPPPGMGHPGMPPMPPPAPNFPRPGGRENEPPKSEAAEKKAEPESESESEAGDIEDINLDDI